MFNERLLDGFKTPGRVLTRYVMGMKPDDQFTVQPHKHGDGRSKSQCRLAERLYRTAKKKGVRLSMSHLGTGEEGALLIFRVDKDATGD